MQPCRGRVLLSILLCAVAQCAAAADAEEDRLRAYLQRYTAPKSGPPRNDVRFSYALVDLNGDGQKEAIVHLVGGGWCGTGGCNTLILKRAGESYIKVCGILRTRPPIKVLAVRTKGWHSLSVYVPGSAYEPGYQAELRFDGARYPFNPSEPPARTLSESQAANGTVVISETAVEVPLYPQPGHSPENKP